MRAILFYLQVTPAALTGLPYPEHATDQQPLPLNPDCLLENKVEVTLLPKS